MRFISKSTGITLECHIEEGEIIEAVHGDDDISSLLNDSANCQIMTEFFAHKAEQREAYEARRQDHFDAQQEERKFQQGMEAA